MAKPHKKKFKVQPVEEYADEPHPYAVLVPVPGPQPVRLCDSCEERLHAGGSVVRPSAAATTGSPTPTSTKSPMPAYVPHPVIAGLALVLLIGLGVLLGLDKLTEDVYWKIVLVTLVVVFAVPAGLTGLSRVLKRILP